jgi:hypothetical protein
MIQVIACSQSFDIRIKPNDVNIKTFPKKSGELTDRIRSAVTELFVHVEQWQMVFVSESELRNLAAKAKTKHWRKKHKTDATLVNPDDLNVDSISLEVRTDLSTTNFENWSVSWKNIFLKSKNRWNILIATIYTIAQIKKIVLRKEIAENPIVAHNFLEFLSKQI